MEFRFLLSLLILFPAIAGIVRYNRMDTAYRPFIWDIFIGVVAEFASLLFASLLNENAIPSNIFILTDCILLLYQFRNWGIFQRRRKLFYPLLIFFIAFWITENLIISRIGVFNSFFRIAYSLTFVLMSINIINRLLITENKSLLKNAKFLICMAAIIFYTYKIIIEVFWHYDSYYSNNFLGRLFDIIVYINALTNILYGIAVLYIPGRKGFSTP